MVDWLEEELREANEVMSLRSGGREDLPEYGLTFAGTGQMQMDVSGYISQQEKAL